MCESRTDWGDSQNDSSEEDFTSSSKILVERVDNERSTNDEVSIVLTDVRLPLCTHIRPAVKKMIPLIAPTIQLS